jgi:hypothetical protein
LPSIDGGAVELSVEGALTTVSVVLAVLVLELSAGVVLEAVDVTTARAGDVLVLVVALFDDELVPLAVVTEVV